MEKKLFAAFEYQKFDPEEKLSAIIKETESRLTKTQLSDEELTEVWAAGSEHLLKSFTEVKK